MTNAWRFVSIAILLVGLTACQTARTGGPAFVLRNCADDALQRVQAADWSTMQTVEIKTGDVLFTPTTLRLKPGQTYLFRITNEDSVGHGFQAREFFKASAVKEVVRKGHFVGPCIDSVWLDPKETIEIQLVAGPAGEYEFVDGNSLVEYVVAGNAAGVIYVE